MKTSFLFGARWLGLYEDFDYDSYTSPVNPASRSSTFIKTHNNLVGGQVGWSTSYKVTNSLALRWDGKGGLFNNFSEQTTFINTPIVVGYSEKSRHTTGSLVGQSSMVATYQFNCNWQCFVGYQVIWLDKMALGPENFNPEYPIGRRTPTVDVGGEVFLHGWRLGMESSW